MPSSPEGEARRGRLAWVALGVILALGSGGVSLLDAPRFDWQPGLALAEPWRAWSAAFVHFSGLHLAANLAGLALVVAYGWAGNLPLRSSLAWLLAWPLTHAALLLRPELLHYGGLSGVLHAGVAVAAVTLLTMPRQSRRWIGAATLLVVVIKVLLETPWGPTLRRPEGWDIAVAPFAHAAGLLVGTALAGAVALLAATRARTRAP
ncbi:MAG: rhombosortase [Pseudomonadota bacterium]|nr:rhombosortase [Pseudomonadota bacterium]